MMVTASSSTFVVPLANASMLESTMIHYELTSP